MKPLLSGSEIALFNSLLRPIDRYLEFGAGGSTVFASQRVEEWVISVESSQEWLDKVAAECAAVNASIVPTTIYVDLGPTGGWGTPTDSSFKGQWPSYHEDVWKLLPASKDADLFFIDGRFRVACAMQILLHGKSDALFAIHDFAWRPKYHIVHDHAKEIARADNLSVFVPRADMDKSRVQNVLDQFRFDPD